MLAQVGTSTLNDALRATRLYWFACRRGDAPSFNPLDEMGSQLVRRVLLNGGRPAYDAYLRSRRWREFRALMLDLVDGSCERCGVSEATSMLLVLDVHHWCYARLGCELPDDVQVLCRPCHREADRERRAG